jgi:hypothetical protein
MSVPVLPLPTLSGAMANPFPDEMDIHTISPEYKREGADWYAVFNPKVKRVLDVQLVHNLMHERYAQRSPISEVAS